MRKFVSFLLTLSLLLTALLPFAVSAQPKTDDPYVTLQLPEATQLIMPSAFGDHMLFQQQKPIGVWGVDVPGTEVQVTLQGNEHSRQGSAVAREDGYWRVELDALDASFERYELTVKGSSLKVYTDVAVGELFLAAGQSNMYLKTNVIIGGAELKSDNKRRNLRMLSMPADPTSNASSLGTPQFSYRGCRWATGIDSASIGDFSAVAYSYARALYDQLNQNGNEVPVGIIDVSMGSLLIEAYLSRRIIEENADVKAALTPGFYKAESAVTNDFYLQITSFYNAKIAPLSGFALRGFLYYQGESNNAYPDKFGVLLDALIEDWSATFGSPDKNLPFICVHVAPHNAQVTNGNRYTNLAGEKWAGLNRAIDKVWRNNRDCMAQVPIYDIDPIADSSDYLGHSDPSQRAPLSHGDDHAIHPLQKRPVGERCAEVAMGLIYGKDTAYIAPTVRTVTQEDGKLLVTFDNVGSGLAIGDATGEVHGFEVCGADGVYLAAKSRIVSADTVEVYSDFLSQPTDVRYAFQAVNVTANLCGSGGMPAVPFCFDKSLSDGTKDWALCDGTKIWVDAGTFFTAVDLSRCTCGVTPLIDLPFTVKGSGYYDAFTAAPISGGKGTFETVQGGTNGAGCIRYTYAAGEDGTAGFGPVLQYTSQDNTFHRLRYIAFDLANPDDRNKQVSSIRLQDYNGKQYTVSLVGETALPADGAFYTFTADLNTLADANGNALSPTQRKTVLQQIKHLQFTVQDGQAGTLLFDNIRFGSQDSDQLPAYLNPTTAPQSSNTLLWVLLAVGIAVAASAAVLTVVLLVKKKKQA